LDSARSTMVLNTKKILKIYFDITDTRSKIIAQ